MAKNFCVFFEFLYNSKESSRSFRIKRIYRGRECLSNNSKRMNLKVDYELETNISRKKLRLLLLHEFRLNHKATEAANNIYSTMGEVYSPFVQRNIGSIVSRMATSNLMTHLILEGLWR